MITLDPIRTNLNIVNTEEGKLVFSYKTHVGTIHDNKLFVQPPYYWSQTTSRHLNEICDKYNLELIIPKAK